MADVRELGALIALQRAKYLGRRKESTILANFLTDLAAKCKALDEEHQHR